MSYLPPVSGFGEVAAPVKTAVAGVNIDYVMVGNVAKPRNKRSLDAFTALQYQLNRVALMLGSMPESIRKTFGITDAPKMIPVDGDIGPLTASLCAIVLSGQGGGDPASVAEMADDYGVQAMKIADKNSVPATIATPPPAAPPSYVDNSGVKVAVPSIATTPQGASMFDAFKNLSTAQMLIGGAAVVAIGALLLMPRKKSATPQ